MIRSLSLLTLTSAMALALAACSGSGSGDGATTSGEPIANIAAPEGRSWTETVRATDAGFLLGNPDAPLKLVEYASPTCSHCADFSIASSEELKGEMVASGRVSLEIRPFMLNSTDVILATVMACGTPDRFFPLLENIYSSREELIAGAQGASEADARAAAEGPVNERLAAMGRVQGIDRFMAARGITPADYNRCLANNAAAERWAQLTQTHSTTGQVTGTPSFDLNGTRVVIPAGQEVWPYIRDRLRAAGAR
jgi:protein-disulfide isomerase